ncbi:MAG: AbrB/MazE/SpoVT family DNA-binding domain-containing protein [Nanoarchaeota archaeon]
MKRKVIQIADSTQLISLPRKWSIAHSIKKGDELEIEEQGSSLIIRTENYVEFEKAKIFIQSADRFIRRPIYTLYKLGYDEVEVEFSDPSIIPLLLKEAEGLLGFEVLEQSNKRVIFRNVAQALDTEFDSVLRRVLLTLITMAKDTSDSISTGDLDALAEIAGRERTNNRLTMFCQRMLNKKGYSDHKKVTGLYQLLGFTEMMADDYRDVAIYLHKNKPKISKDEAAAFKMLADLVDKFNSLFHSHDLGGLIEYKQLKNEAETLGMSLLLKNSKGSQVIGHYVLTIVDKAHHMAELIS